MIARPTFILKLLLKYEIYILKHQVRRYDAHQRNDEKMSRLVVTCLVHALTQ
jgi:hypothetical protein